LYTVSRGIKWALVYSLSGRLTNLIQRQLYDEDDEGDVATGEWGSVTLSALMDPES